MQIIANQIIDALGGTTSVARLTETPLSTVHSWRKKGIPRSRLSHLRLVADREGIAIDWDTGARIDHVTVDTAAPQQASRGKAENDFRAVSA